MIVAYVSGHGFGHATRTAEVLRVVRERAPLVPLSIVTSAPEALFRDAIPGPLAYRRLECDVGLAQRDALVIDEEETARRFSAFVAGWETLVTEESAFLRTAGARLVLGDVPPLAFATAARASVPSFALANFSWDWIYRYAARRAPALLGAAEHCAAAYGEATLLLRLPFAGDLGAFPRVVDLPLVTRRPKVAKDEARRRLGLDVRPVVLLSFGGIGLPGFAPEVLAPLTDFQFLLPAATGLPAHATSVTADRLRAAGLRYEDVVGAVDVVVTKPGYGIVTDALGARTRLVYTERGDFPEYEILVRELPALLPCAYVSNEDLRAGRLEKPIRSVLAQPFPEPPDLSGAEKAADRLLDSFWE